MYWVVSSLGVTTLVVLAITFLARYARAWLENFTMMKLIPTIGLSVPPLSYVGAFRLLVDTPGMLEKGYRKYKDRGMFKVADFQTWMVVVTGPRFIEDIRKAPPDVLVFEAAINEALHTLVPKVRRSHFHVPIIKNQLTRQLRDSFPDICEEVSSAFGELLVEMGSGWSSLPALNTSLDVVTRTVHRLFVGLPLCREPGYKVFNMKLAVDIGLAASTIRLLPKWLRFPIGRMFVNVPSALDRVVMYLRPLVEERQRQIALYGENYAGKPEDLLTWFMDEVDGNTDEEKLIHIAFHFLMINFGAVYTTAMSFTQALYYLAENPQYIQPLRDEIETVTSEDGWTKDAMSKLRKVDSFLKESQRLNGLAASWFIVSTYRRVLQPFTFSNGVRIPAGVTLAIAAHSTHLDESIYFNAKAFDGFRFVNDEGEGSQMVAPSSEYLPFGVGRHLCPGRFLTVVTMKVMMAHLLMNYDIKLEEGGKRPGGSWFLTENLPHMTAKVMIRKRSVL